MLNHSWNQWKKRFRERKTSFNS